MRYSNYFIHTLFDVPKEAETPSHILLLRGSYIYPVAAGLYCLLPLGRKVANKVADIVREEMNGIGGLEITMPVLNPAELWKKTGRYFDIGPELFRIKDRKDREFVLAMTHEEVVTDIARQFLRSYRDLPVMLYQIQTKIRDEARPRAGLLRVREFFMKDAYSFHRDFKDLDAYYPRVFNAYLRIFGRCGLTTVPIEADTGIMGGTGSHEFMLEAPSGEDQFVVCTHCDYRANTEKAAGLKDLLRDLPESPPEMEKVSTPRVRTIAELMEFFGSSDKHFIKTVAYEADGNLVLAMVRGDFAISDTKLANHLKAIRLEMASEELLSSKGLVGGFLSPIGIKGIRMVMDTSIDGGSLFIAGGNEPDVHYKNVLPGRDFAVEDTVDIAEVRSGDRCSKCGEGTVEMRRGVELGHTFKLGTKYTDPKSMDVGYLDTDGEQHRVIMGCYGIGVERLVAAVVERCNDASGIVWPISVAPFEVLVTAIGREQDVMTTIESIYARLSERFEVLFDDRDESPGVKFKDADLLGVPIRVVVSRRLMKTNEVEIKVRKTGEVIICPRDALESTLEKIRADLQPSLEGQPYMPE